MSSDKSVTRGRREREKERRRASILQCAEEIMQEKGMTALNMDAVAQRAELAKGTLYLYFKNKEEILSQLTVKARHLILTTFQEFAARHSDPLEQIAAIIRSNLHIYHQYPLFNDLIAFYEGNSYLEETAELRDASIAIVNFIVEIIASGKERKLIRESLDAAQFAYTLWGMTVGMLQLVNVKKEMLSKEISKTEEDMFENYIEIIMHGIRA